MMMTLYKTGRRLVSLSLFTSLWLLTSISFGGSREWSDSTGTLKIRGTLLAADESEVVIKLDKKEKGRELLAVAITDLSAADREFLKTQEAESELKLDGEKHAWELKNGLKVFGRAVSFVRKDVVMQRRRGKLYVNDRPMDNLPEVYQKMIPYVVGYFEKTTFETKRQFDDWVISQRNKINTYPCEALMIEFPNGDEYGVPLFFFSESVLERLKPAYEKWQSDTKAKLSEDEQSERQRQNDLYLQSHAAAYQQQQQEMMQIAKLQLLMNSVSAGATDLWEVYMYPGPGTFGYPISVVVAGRNSQQASQLALQNNPGHIVGPIRKVAGF
ncbi:MAG: hypothetical protein MUC83_07665 [Pirellula sp.]|nr:hypothetical protein [Pirellula sp.]